MFNSAFFRRLRHIPRTIAFIWASSRTWTIAWIVLLVIGSITPVANVILTGLTVDQAVSFVQSDLNFDSVQPLLIPLVLLVLVQVLDRVLMSLMQLVRTGQSETIRDAISAKLHLQASRLDMSYYEESTFHDLLYRVQSQSRERPLHLLEGIGFLIKNAISLVGLTVLLLKYGAWILPFLLVTMLPPLLVLTRFNWRYAMWRKQMARRERENLYYDYLLTDYLPAPEIRLFGLSELFRSHFLAMRSGLRAEHLKQWRRKVFLDILIVLWGVVVLGFVLGWMGLQVLMQAATLGDFAALYRILTEYQATISSSTTRFGDLYQSLVFLEDLYYFLDLEPRLDAKEGRAAAPLQHEIRFENVTFSYPSSERAALSNFSMTIPAGKIIALVGENGEGKTTLMKLLCRYYDPRGGRILWDGVDLRELSAASLHIQITMLFQRPFQYADTARENIARGNKTSQPSQDQIEEAARLAGAHDFIASLPDGYGTMLSKLFGGEELSIGQWQRVALARAFLRKASLIILDEPTSAMDAWAEMDWLSRVRDAAANSTMIMITHRFTTAMHADTIYVLHDHQIVERGTHAELLALNGRYATSWKAQMREIDVLSEQQQSPD